MCNNKVFTSKISQILQKMETNFDPAQWRRVQAKQ